MSIFPIESILTLSFEVLWPNTDVRSSIESCWLAVQKDRGESITPELLPTLESGKNCDQYLLGESVRNKRIYSGSVRYVVDRDDARLDTVRGLLWWQEDGGKTSVSLEYLDYSEMRKLPPGGEVVTTFIPAPLIWQITGYRPAVVQYLDSVLLLVVVITGTLFVSRLVAKSEQKKSVAS